MPRWDFPEDRLKLHRWLAARSSSRALRVTDQSDRVVLWLQRGDVVRCWGLSYVELETCRAGWRSLIAYAIGELRHSLRPRHAR